MTLDVGSISSGLRRGDGGIFFAERASRVSYPDDGNLKCAQVEAGSFWFEHRNRCIVEALRRLPPPGTIVDVGGGNGFVAAALLASGFDTVLLEPGRAGATLAKVERRIPQVICATLEDAGFAPASLPAAGLFDVLEHVEDDRGLLEELAVLLRPSGRLYLTVPAHRLLWSGVDVAAGHYRRYSLAALSRKLSRAGFRIDYATYFFAFLPLPILLFRALPSRLGVRGERTAGRIRRDHLAGGSMLRGVLRSLLAREVEKVRRGARMRLGASCLAVASLPAPP